MTDIIKHTFIFTMITKKLKWTDEKTSPNKGCCSMAKILAQNLSLQKVGEKLRSSQKM